MTTAIPLKFPDWLAKQLTSLEKHRGNNTMQGKKYYILDMAFRQFWDMGCSPPADASVLGPDADKYKISKSTSPDYFSKDTFTPQTVQIDHSEGKRYDYTTYDPNKFFVDFANRHLGGGIFGDGYAQEEMMCCETPDLANAAAAGEIVTRDGEDGVVAGHPTPVVIQKVHRVISIDDSIYENLETPLLDTLPDKIKLIKPVPFNVLAIAAPKLEKKETSPQPDTLRDLFNTFMAGFQLARDIVPNATIHTGPIGCGIFNNNRYVVWVLQTFAAHQVGVNLHFWSYSNSEATNAQDDYKAILTAFGTGNITKLLDTAAKTTWPHL